MSLGQSTILATDGACATDDLETVFRLHYGRITRLIARILRDPGRAEELAVEVFLRWNGSVGNDPAATSGWLSRTAVRIALDELRRQELGHRFRWLTLRILAPRDPAEVARARTQQTVVMSVLSRLPPRDAEILMLRAEGLSYDELSTALGLHAASVGKLLSRAQDAFRKEYVKRHESRT